MSDENISDRGRRHQFPAPPVPAAAIAGAPAKPQPIAIVGINKPVRFRFAQLQGWKLVVGLLAAAVIAGGYAAITQVNWYVHVGPVYFHIFYLKHAWDAGKFMRWLISPQAWPLFRHAAFRDLLEPEIGIMAVLTLIAKQKYWGKKANTFSLVTRPFVVIIVAVVLNLGLVWIIDFGLPHAWHAAFGHYVLPYTGWLGAISAANLLIGVLIGRVLHPLWAPVGATLQEFQLKRGVARADKRNRIPLWVLLPVTPPTIRERFSLLWQKRTILKQAAGTHRVALTVISVITFLLLLLGLASHYYVGTLGHSIPYLFPGH